MPPTPTSWWVSRTSPAVPATDTITGSTAANVSGWRRAVHDTFNYAIGGGADTIIGGGGTTR